jgi:hypothetical protein
MALFGHISCLESILHYHSRDLTLDLLVGGE